MAGARTFNPDRDVMRDVGARLRRVERRRAVVIGPWVLDVRESDGALIATHRPTGTVRELVELDQPCPETCDQPEMIEPVESLTEDSP